MSVLLTLPTVQNWNAYLGKLPSKTLCVSKEGESSPLPTQCTTASAFVDFHIDSGVLQEAVNHSITIFRGVFSGTMLNTKIKSNEAISLSLSTFVSVLSTVDSITRERIDDQVNVTLYLSLNISGEYIQLSFSRSLPVLYVTVYTLHVGCDNSSQCRHCVDICAPGMAVPARHPQIPYTDFTFDKRVVK